MTTTELARAYLSAPHQPEHESYKAFAQETRQQFRRLMIGTLERPGLGVILTRGTETPSSAEMFQWLDTNWTIQVAEEGAGFEPGHPLEQIVDGISLNTMFRVVHDVNGHYRARALFETFSGEIAAYKAHREMYSPLARPALFCETVLQLCHFCAFGEYVPTQKCVIL